jgi:hypothetical protein
VCGTEGFCVVENKPDNSACDLNPCTTGEACQAGVCTGGTTVVGCVLCTNNTQCATVGSPTQCQEGFCQANGTCGIRNKADNTSCDLGACTTGETCQSGVCQGGTAVTCPGNQICCPSGTNAGQCKPSLDKC